MFRGDPSKDKNYAFVAARHLIMNLKIPQKFSILIKDANILLCAAGKGSSLRG